jgi:hypothetical protein
MDPRPGQVTKRLKWIERKSIRPFFDLAFIYPEVKHAVAYAYTRLQVDDELEGILWIGSDDCARVWLDGRLIHDNPFRMHEGPDTHKIPITLSQGCHRLLVKISQWDHRWGFYLRFSRADGSMLQGLVPFVNPKGPSAMATFDARAHELTPDEILSLIPLDKKPKLTFDSEQDLERIFVTQCNDMSSFDWCLHPDEKIPNRPNPGAEGIISVHPVDEHHPVRIYRKFRVVSRRSRIVTRLSACAPEVDENADWIARLGVYDGTMRWIHEEVISAKNGWHDVTAVMDVKSGTEVLLVLQCACGGPGGNWVHDQAFIDTFSVKNF